MTETNITSAARRPRSRRACARYSASTSRTSGRSRTSRPRELPSSGHSSSKSPRTAYHAYVCQLNWLQSKIQEFTTAHHQALSNGDLRDDNDFNKPIWLTEFACGDKPASWPSITQQHQIDYVNAALPWLEGDSRIMRYAWFSGRTAAVPNASLLGSSGQLTALGRAYLAQAHNPSCSLKPYTP